MKTVLSRLTPFLSPALILAGLFIITSPLEAHAATALKPATIISLTNEDRKDRGLRPLIEDRLLNAAAQKKANDMAARGYFSHIDPNGNAPWKWFTSVGFYYTRAGENLAIDFSDARALEKAWMRSPSHRANIMDKGYTRVGIGVAQGWYNGEKTTFVVQFFARPAVFASTPMIRS